MKLRDLATNLKVPQDRIIEVGLDIDIDLDDYPNDIPKDIADKIAAQIKGDTKQLAAATLSTPAPSASQPTTGDAIAAATTPKELADATGGGAYSNSADNAVTANLREQVATYKAKADAALDHQVYVQTYWGTLGDLQAGFTEDLISNYKKGQHRNQARFNSLQNNAKETQQIALEREKKLAQQIAEIQTDIANVQSFLSA